MWDVSDRFLSALSRPHRNVTTITATPPGGSEMTLRLKGGQVSADSRARIRRTASLSLFTDGDEYVRFAAPGTLFKIVHGIRFGTTTELVPVFAGEMTTGKQSLGDGTATMTLADHGQWLARTRFVTPFNPSPDHTRKVTIEQIVATAKPGVAILDEATDDGRVGTQVWQNTRPDAITQLCNDGGMDAYFRPDDVFAIRDQPTLASPSVWTVSAGSNGTLKSLDRDRPTDELYNTVVVQPSTPDQTWTQQVASITDPNHPRHPDKIGIVPYFWASPTILTAATAMGVAHRMLDRVQGTSETLSFNSISNPAIEAGDVIRVISPSINRSPAQIFQHFLDSFTLDLVTGDMTAATRSQVVDA